MSPEEIRSKNNAWFVVYHNYSVSSQYSPKAVRLFKQDVEIAANKLDVKYVIIEDYFKNLVWGEFGRLWSEETFRGFIRAAHDAGVKVLPYMDATELSITGEEYPKNGKKWGAKTSWGKIYSGYSSILYPSVYFLPEYDWFGKIMCPASGWTDFLVSQLQILHEKFDIDGFYLDRVDYRLKCHDHSKDPGHFNKALVKLVQKLQKTNKSYGNEKFLIVNDSCMAPDENTKRIFKIADGILSELLLADMDPYALENKIAVLFGDLIWKFKWGIRTVLTYILPRIYKTSLMTNRKRIHEIISRIRNAAGSKDLWLFSHRTDSVSRNFLSENIDSPNTHLCFYTGRERLKNIFK
ncbi:MAG: DUF6259 domain-containing protein [Promethearchaeota archaeon]